MDFLNNFNLDRFLFSLQYMWQGMLCIFIVIGVIILFVFALNKITSSIEAKKKAKKEAAETAENSNS